MGVHGCYLPDLLGSLLVQRLCVEEMVSCQKGFLGLCIFGSVAVLNVLGEQ